MEVVWGYFVAFVFPLSIVALGLGYSAFQRYLSHKERMAMINQGLIPAEIQEQKFRAQPRPNSNAPMILTLIGVAITLGLSTIGIGPWLIGGLIPTAIGCAMLIGQIGASKQKHDNGKGAE